MTKLHPSEKRRRRETKHSRRRIARALYTMPLHDVQAVEMVVRLLRGGLGPGEQIVVDGAS